MARDTKFSVGDRVIFVYADETGRVVDTHPNMIRDDQYSVRMDKDGDIKLFTESELDWA